MKSWRAVGLCVLVGLVVIGAGFASGATTAATPTFKPAGGTYTTAQTVTIGDTTTGAVIYYTTNGTKPTASSTKYTAAIKVSATETIEAIAVASGLTTSAVATATYTITPPAATPTFKPAAGTYTSVQSVTVADATSGATIYYTTNGAAPTVNSTKYTSAISVGGTETVKGIAIATGHTSSAVASATYTLNLPAATPTFSLAAGTYAGTQSVTLADGTSGANIYYTTNATTPSANSSKCSGAIQVKATETIEAIATASGHSTSGVASARYVILPVAATPSFKPAGGTYTAAQTVTISDTSNNTGIYYTTDGSTPTTSSTKYTAAVSVGATETLKAVAAGAGYGNSTVAAATYTINLPTPKTYYVSGTGKDSNSGLSISTPFQTLQHAADLTKPGDTVYVMDGTYTAPSTCLTCDVLDINNAGTADHWITYAAYPGQTPKISTEGWAGIFVHATAAYIVINGLNIEGNNYNVTLEEALAQDTTYNPAYDGNCISIDGRAGTATQRSHHIKVTNNTIWACGGGGVGTAWSDYVTISGNTIYDSAWYSLFGGSAISTWQNWMFDQAPGYHMIIEGNRIFGNQELVPVDVNGVATSITDGEAVIIDSTRNSAYQSGDTLPPYTPRTLIANNVAYGNGSAAYEVFESDHVDVVNNSSYQDVLNPSVSGRGEMNLVFTNDDNVLNNIFYSTAGQNPISIYGIGPDILVDYNIYFGGTNLNIGNGPHDIVADPQYVAPAASSQGQRDAVNLSVEPSSQAVGTGTANLAPATDFLGNPRPGAKGYDRGAYQQQ